jgi:hypothetical protein
MSHGVILDGGTNAMRQNEKEGRGATPDEVLRHFSGPGRDVVAGARRSVVVTFSTWRRVCTLLGTKNPVASRTRGVGPLIDAIVAKWLDERGA